MHFKLFLKVQPTKVFLKRLSKKMFSRTKMQNFLTHFVKLFKRKRAILSGEIIEVFIFLFRAIVSSNLVQNTNSERPFSERTLVFFEKGKNCSITPFLNKSTYRFRAFFKKKESRTV